MSLAAAAGWSLARSLAITGLAVPICRWLARRLPALPYPARHAAWALLAVPLLFPPLLSGYAFSSAGLQLAESLSRGLRGWPLIAGLAEWIADHHAAVDEGVLDLLLLVRAVPAGTILLACVPRGLLSDAALFCRRLAFRPHDSRALRAWTLLRYGWLGRLRTAVAAAGLMFLVCFQEFELASLLGRPAWTVWLYDAQAGRLSLADSARTTAGVMLVQLAVIALVWCAIGRAGSLGSTEDRAAQRVRPAVWRNACYLLAAAALACGMPLTLVGGDAVRGFQMLLSDSARLEMLARQTLAGCLMALLAAGVASSAAYALLRSRTGTGVLVALCLPGLFGSLLMSLALVRMFQSSWLNVAYRTPLSFLIGLFFFLLPRAALLQAVVAAARRREAVWLAELLTGAPEPARRLAGRELGWRLGGAVQFWSLGLLTYWGYLEMTVAYLLGPATIVSVPVYLYNQMHFGKYAVTSATTCLTVAAPAALFLAAAAGRRILLRWLWR